MKRSSSQATRWADAINRSGKPAYLAIADAIAGDIDSGALKADERLPTLRSLARDLELNFTTVARAYGEAQRRGLIDARPGHGTVVRGPAAAAAQAPPPSLDMMMNMPPEPRDAALLARFEQGLAGLRGGDPYALLRYQAFGGTEADRAAGARWLSEALPGVDAQQVLVCPGMQGALLALFSVLARPGETIACEAVTYSGIQGLAAQLGVRLAGLPVDDEGLDPRAFEALCARELPKALYCNPTLCNPTTTTWTLRRREAVVAVARRHGVPIIEDDAYARLPDAAPPPLARLAPELGFYLSGLSKCVGAGLRIAYLTTPGVRYATRVSAMLRTTAVMASPLLAALATRWVLDGTAQAAALAVREESRQRQRLAARILRSAAYAAAPEGFHLWLKVPAPWTRVGLAAHLRAQGIGAVVADAFTVAGPVPEAMRICLGGPAGREDCGRWLEIIEDAIGQPPALASRVM